MSSSRSWLPANAVDRGASELPLAALVESWASKWLGHGDVRLVGKDASIGLPLTNDGEVWENPDGLVLTLAASASETLSNLLYGQPDTPGSLTAADRATLDAAAGICVADLRSHLARGLDLPGDRPWRAGPIDPDAWMPWRHWHVEATDGRWLIRLSMSEALIADWLKGRIVPLPVSAPLVPLSSALAGQAIDISAFVGDCALSTKDLARLEIGDVVLLDRPSSKACMLAVNHEITSSSLDVDEIDGRLRLTLI